MLRKASFLAIVLSVTAICAAATAAAASTSMGTSQNGMPRAKQAGWPPGSFGQSSMKPGEFAKLPQQHDSMTPSELARQPRPVTRR